MKTRAAVLYELNNPLVIEEIEIPKLRPGQVLVKMQASGICRTQLNEVKGWKGADKFLPHLLGHEAAGIVEDIGSSVVKVKTGDHVVATWIKGEGADVSGTQYLLGKKVINAGAISTFTDHAVISENRLVKIPAEVPSKVAALLGCAVPTGAGIILHTLKVTPDSSIVVFGAGGVGAAAIQASRMEHCDPIIAVDISQDKLSFARIMGADHTLLYSDDIAEKITELTHGGADYAVEASGNRFAMEKTFEVIRPGGKMALAGNLKKGEKISIDPFGLIAGKRILGSWGGDTVPDRDIPAYAKAYLAGTLPAEKMISKVIPLEQINESLRELEEGKVNGRIIIVFSEKA